MGVCVVCMVCVWCVYSVCVCVCMVCVCVCSVYGMCVYGMCMVCVCVYSVCVYSVCTVSVCTLRQGPPGLGVEQQVQAGEGSVSQQGGGEAREQGPGPLQHTHTPQRSCYAAVVIPAALQQIHTHTGQHTDIEIITHCKTEYDYDENV